MEYLAHRWEAPAFRREGPARVARVRRDGIEVVLLKPWTYMNRSGSALAGLLADPGFDPARDLLVAVDDVALPPGRFRLRGAGTAGGHNGLRSIEAALRRQDYARLRIGVGQRPPDWPDLADWVLTPLDPGEREAIEAPFDLLAQAVECWLAEGIEITMTRFNRS